MKKSPLNVLSQAFSFKALMRLIMWKRKNWTSDCGNLNVHTSGSPAADRQHSEQRGCAWHGSASPERCTPPSRFHGCGPAGSCGASLPAAVEWLLEHRGIRAVC